MIYLWDMGNKYYLYLKFIEADLSEQSVTAVLNADLDAWEDKGRIIGATDKMKTDEKVRNIFDEVDNPNEYVNKTEDSILHIARKRRLEHLKTGLDLLKNSTNRDGPYNLSLMAEVSKEIEELQTTISFDPTI